MKLTSDEIRKKYLQFFESKGHVRISPAPLVLEGDPTTLFTSAGMQPLIPYLKGEPHPDGKRLVDSQPSLRLQDIEEVGDNRHTTFFEMLGNWSLGDYFKKEQLGWILEFFTEELKLSKEKLWISVFEGTKEVPRDEESYNRWLELGIPKEHIHFYGVDKNWWSRSGAPDKMPPGEIGGPDSEIFYDFGEELNTHTDKDHPCHPNCDCGRFLEIGNSVFIQYEKQKDGSLRELPQKNVDFGGGLERITAVVNGNFDVFQIDIYKPIIEKIERITKKNYQGNEKPMRIIADHLRAAENISNGGIVPGNKGHEYILRRLIRRALDSAFKLGINESLSGVLITKRKPFVDILIEEEQKYKRLDKKSFTIYVDMWKVTPTSKKISGVEAFNLYSTHGLSPEKLRMQGYEFDEDEFVKAKLKHQELSRETSSGMFKGGLAEHTEDVTKLHTTTHLLHASLRKVLGEHVSQKGSNITAKRLRFDFSHPQKLTEDEVKRVEDLVNGAIDAKLPVTFETKNLDEAITEGALHFFAEKYGEKVKVYTVGDLGGEFFSKEVCGGPHVANTSEIGHVRIIKQEKVGSGVVRIYATNKVQD